MSIFLDLKGLAHKIRCPRHYILKPGGSPFVLERNPLFKNISEADAKRAGVTVWRNKKDAWGRPITNFDNYIQPEISASLVREKIYSPDNPICAKCHRCLCK